MMQGKICNAIELLQLIFDLSKIPYKLIKIPLMDYLCFIFVSCYFYQLKKIINIEITIDLIF